MKQTATDKSQKDFRSKLDGYAKKDLNKARLFLNRVIAGKEQDSVYDPKSGTIITKPAPIAVRVDACNALNKLVVSKSIPEVKEQQKKDVGKHTVDDAVERVEKRKRAEEAAKKAAQEKGKLAKTAIGG